MPRRMTTEEFVHLAKKKHNNKYDYIRTEYVLSTRKVTILCAVHGEFRQSPAQHLTGQGCAQCGAESRHASNRTQAESQRIGFDEFLRRAAKLHGSRYDYSLVEFNSTRDKVSIICPDHGSFSQLVIAHVRYGQGCPTCFRENRFGGNFFELAKSVHGTRYDYSKVDLSCRGKNTSVIIICHEHGAFQLAPSVHIQKKKGCPKCGSKEGGRKRAGPKFTTVEFIERAKEVHGDLYDYSSTQYMGMKYRIDIQCRKHGVFKQRASDHINGNGCQRCASSGSSEMEIAWLDHLGVSQRQVNIDIGANVKVDGYDPITNTVYEFLGDYWHGNPVVYEPHDTNKRVGKTFGVLLAETSARLAELSRHGYNVVTIWESEWLAANENHLQNGRSA